MTWRGRVWRLLRGPALAAGGVTTAALGANAAGAMGDGLEAPGNPDRGPVLLPNTLNATAEDRYAAHRSHSSHRSHRSHRSSSGGVRQAPSTPAPQPQYQPPPSNQAPSVIPRTTPRIERTIPKPTPQDVSRMVIRVQAALMRRGLYNGDIDGLLGPKTRAALRAFQQIEGIPQSGRMDIATLTRLGITIP